MGCLLEETLVGFVEGTLAPHERPRITDHLDTCDACRKLVAELARGVTSAPAGGSVAFAETVPVSGRTTMFASGDSVGRYRVIEPIGAGGMGVVYAAHDPELDRRIALKLVRASSSASAADARLRLVREAQAMARLSHPNVVTVFDAGSIGEQVFIAMELVDGRTLAVWMRERARTARDVVTAFVAAGRGLAAAHAKGLVHRDFKPSNVLVGWDGTIRVTDFGLVRALGAADDERAERAERAERVPPPSPPYSILTRTGALLGTPAYMAPEQYEGRSIDARSDQFGFCVALYEALHGARPFAGDTIEELFANVRGARLYVPDGARRVPSFFRRALARGLRADPRERFPTMEALLAALAADPATRRWRIATAAAAALAIAAAAIVAYRPSRAPSATPCRGAEERLAGIWDPTRKEAIAGAFAAIDKPFARDALRAAQQRLDAYATSWTAMHTDACEATRVRGDQTEAILALRMVCLDDRRRELRALTDLLATADTQVVEKAVQASAALTAVAGCADLNALTARVPAPGDPAVAERVLAVRTRLAETRTLLDTGKHARGLELAASATADARATGYSAVLAEALYLLGNLQQKQGEYATGEATIYEAAWTAEAARHDEVSARAWTNLVWLVGYRQARFEEGLRIARQATAAIARMGGSDEIASEVESSVANILYGQGKYEAAIDGYKKAAVLREKALGVDDPSFAGILGNTGAALATMGRFDEALLQYARALAIREKALGPEHPDLGTTLVSTAIVYRRASRYPEAIATYERALRIYENAYGEDHPSTAMCLNNLAFAQTSAGLHEKALANGERALAIGTKRLGPDHPEIADALDTTAHALAGLGRAEEAVVRYERAVAIVAKSSGASHPNVAKHLTGLGVALLAAGKPKPALAPLERAHAIRSAPGIAPLELAETRFALARALWDATRGATTDRARARELAEGAREAYERAASPALAEVSRWLASHAG